MSSNTLVEKKSFVKFDPDVFIEIDDVMTGVRKLGKVLPDGISYVDLVGEGEAVFPIHAELKPEEVGNILGWGLYMVDQKPEQYHEWEALVTKMINSGLDSLTYNRGLLWAFRAENFDFAQAYKAGVDATAIVENGRKAMDKMIETSGVLA
jgi:hypothetical protein